jgi:hypothetical protein
MEIYKGFQFIQAPIIPENHYFTQDWTPAR